MIDGDSPDRVTIPTDIGPAIQILVGTFDLDALTRLSQGLAAVVATLDSCTREDAAVNGSNVEPLVLPPRQRSRLCLEQKAEIIKRNAAGERYETIARAVGCQSWTIGNVVRAHRKASEKGELEK